MSSSTVARPLVVDLDGTLIATDTLHEAASAYLVHAPLQAFRLAGWLRGSKALLKSRLATSTEFDASVLPYRQDVLSWLEAEHRSGRRLVLATASEASQVQGDEVYVVGAANSAGQAALNLSRFAKSVVLVVRGESLTNTMSQYLIGRLSAAPNIRMRYCTEVSRAVAAS